MNRALKEVREQAIWISWGNGIEGRGNSKCRDSEVGKCLVCAGNSKEASVAGAEGRGNSR